MTVAFLKLLNISCKNQLTDQNTLFNPTDAGNPIINHSLLPER